MRKMFLPTAALLAVAILTFPANAQDAKKEAPIKPADSPSKVLLDSWNDIGRKLIAMAEDFPEDKYDFTPTPPPAHLCRATSPRRQRELFLHQFRPR